MAKDAFQRIKSIPKNLWQMGESEKREWAKNFLRDFSPNPNKRNKSKNPNKSAGQDI
jgi:hypothetical protein